MVYCAIEFVWTSYIWYKVCTISMSEGSYIVFYNSNFVFITYSYSKDSFILSLFKNVNIYNSNITVLLLLLYTVLLILLKVQICIY